MARKLSKKAIDNLVNDAYHKHGNGVQVPILGIPKIFAAGHKAFAEGGADAVEPAVAAAIAALRVN